ncbi:MAG: hypothetical protein WBI83_04875 [bacterium]|nr:hypothetical protein [Bacillota bacterium]
MGRRAPGRNSKGYLLKVYCLLFILAVGSIGVGYGAFSDGLQLAATVYTGNIAPVFLDGSPSLTKHLVTSG